MQQDSVTQTTKKSKATPAAASIDNSATEASNGKWVSRESYDALVERGTELISSANKTATGYVSSHPMQAAVGGLVVGFLLGAAIFRRPTA